MPKDKPAHTASEENRSPRSRTKSADDKKQESKFGIILRRLWFKILNFAESYNLRTLTAILCWMLIVWIIGTNLIWMFEQSLPPGEGNATSAYYGSERYLDAYWKVIIAITSAGVDDAFTPQTLGARIVTIIVVILGICLITVFTGNVVAMLWERIARHDYMRIKPRFARVSQYEGHIIICNASAKFEPIVRQIVDKVSEDTMIVLVDPKASEYRTDRRSLFRTTFAVRGDPQRLRVLRQADIRTASALVALTPDEPSLSLQERDYHALLTALAAQPIAEHNPDLRILVEVNLPITLRFVEIFNQLDQYPLYIEAVYAGDFQQKLISQACLTPGISHFFDLLLTVPSIRPKKSAFSQMCDTILMREMHEDDQLPSPVDMENNIYTVSIPKSMIGKTYREVRLTVEIEGVTVIGYLRWEGKSANFKKPVVTLNPSRNLNVPDEPAPIDYRFCDDDQLLIIARPAAYQALRETCLSHKSD